MEIDDFRGEVFARRFFDFFRDLSSGMLAFETKIGRPSPEMVSKVSEPCERSLKKSKKHCTGASQSQKLTTVSRFCTIWNSSPDSPDSPDPADPPEAVASAAARTLPTSRAGGHDDGS